MELEQTEKLEVLKQFERGRRLFHLVRSDGWGDLLDIIEVEVIKSEYRLMNTVAGASNELLRDLHAHARAARSIFEQVQLRVNAAIESGKEVPQIDDALDYQTTNL